MPRNYPALALVVLAAAAFGVRENRNYQHVSAARQIPEELDGQLTSLPFEPFGRVFFLDVLPRCPSSVSFPGFSD